MDVEIVRSGRKTIAIQINPDLSVTVRAPYRVSLREINRFLAEKEDWIQKHKQIVREREQQKSSIPDWTADEIKELTDKARQYIPERVGYYASVIGVDYRSVTIRHQKTRWGSCSAKGGLNFNCLLMLAPPEVIDYVVVHELCHRKEMNHSRAFWTEVERVLPEYKASRKWLRENGNRLMPGTTGN